MDRRGFLSSSLAAAAFPLSDAATVEVEEPDSADGGWRCYGFDDGNTGFAEGEGGPVDGVDVRWSYDTGGAVLSSPSVVSGSVYVGSWSGGMHRLDVESGEVEWWFETGGRRDVHGLESGGGFPVDGGVESGPCVDGESVYFGAYDGYLYSLDRGTGEEQWRYGTPSILRSSPVVVDETVYIGDWTGDVHAVEAGSGEGLWRYSTGFDSVYSTPCYVDDVVYFGSASFGWGDGEGGFHAVDASSGEELWSRGFEGVVSSSPSYFSDVVYFGSFDQGFYAVDVADGDVRWSYRGDAGFGVSPAVDGDSVYVGDVDGSVYSFDAVDGDLNWRVDVDTRFYAGGVSIGDEAIYLGGEDAVYGFDRGTGEALWGFEVGDEVRSRPAVIDGAVYFGERGGRVYAVEEGDGGFVPEFRRTGGDDGVAEFEEPVSSTELWQWLRDLMSGV